MVSVRRADRGEPPNATVPRRPLGRTGAIVSAIGLGGHHIGVTELSDAESVRLMRIAIDAGIDLMGGRAGDRGAGHEAHGRGKASGGQGPRPDRMPALRDEPAYRRGHHWLRIDGPGGAGGRRRRSFRQLTGDEMRSPWPRAARAARDGRLKACKAKDTHDGASRHPQWPGPRGIEPKEQASGLSSPAEWRKKCWSER